MRKFKLAVPIIVAAVMGIIFYAFSGYSQSPQPSVRLTTDPPVAQILPFEAEATRPQSPVRLTLQAVDVAGNALENAKVRLTILTPPKNPWLSTDFPIVEGTELLDVEGIAPKGEFQVQQILPIRGTYQLLVNIEPTVENAFKPFQETLSLSVRENALKYRNFGILLAILLIVGFGGGWVMGGSQRIEPGEIAPTKVRLLLSGAIVVAIAALLVVNVSAEIAESHVHTHEHHEQEHHEHDDNQAASTSAALDVKWFGDVEARVGQPAQLALQINDPKTGQPATDVALKIKATQVEGEQTVSVYQDVPDARGEVMWKQQFFDGSPHKLEVEVSPQPGAVRQFAPFQVSQEIEVEGVAPPMHVRLISLAYFTGTLVLGLLLGLWIRRSPIRHSPSPITD